MDKNTSVNDYIAKYTESTREILQQIRKIIADVAPNAIETMSYGIPTFDVNGKHLIHFAAYKNHIGLYPGPKTIEEFGDKLKQYKTSKGTIQLPIDKPMPAALIQQITKYQLDNI